MLWLLASCLMVLPLLPLRGRLAFRWWEWALLVTIAGPILGITYAVVESLGMNWRGPMRDLLALAMGCW